MVFARGNVIASAFWFVFASDKEEDDDDNDDDDDSVLVVQYFVSSGWLVGCVVCETTRKARFKIIFYLPVLDCFTAQEDPDTFLFHNRRLARTARINCLFEADAYWWMARHTPSQTNKKYRPFAILVHQHDDDDVKKIFLSFY